MAHGPGSRPDHRARPIERPRVGIIGAGHGRQRARRRHRPGRLAGGGRCPAVMPGAGRASAALVPRRSGCCDDPAALARRRPGAPDRARRRHRDRRGRASGCGPGRPSCTPAVPCRRASWPRPGSRARRAASFHPLVAFADLERPWRPCPARPSPSRATPTSWRSWRSWRPTWVRGRSPCRPAGKAAYHAAAVLAAGGFVALLDVIAELGRVAGLDERDRARDVRAAHPARARQRRGAGRPGCADGPAASAATRAPCAATSRPSTGSRPASRDALRGRCATARSTSARCHARDIDDRSGRARCADHRSNP